jgi:hypothetical protein
MPSDAQRTIEVMEFMQGTDRLPKRKLLTWLRSTDPDVLGATYSAAANHWSRLEPNITRVEFGRLVGRVLTVALRRKGGTHFSMSDYQAARTFMGWMLECLKDRKSDPDAERCLKWAVALLASLYRGGRTKNRRCLVDGALEHLFAVPDVARYFRAWKRDKVLRRAYREAMEWVRDADSGGNWSCPR